MQWAAIGVLFLVIWIIKDDPSRPTHQERAPAPSVQYGSAQTSPETVAAAPSAIVAVTPVSDAETVLINTSRTYDLPAGFLYGIWHVESGGLEGWYSAKWVRAVDAIQPGGACRAEYSEDFCNMQWASIVALCRQERSGRPICDPNQVRTSRALALGPMQFLPTNIIAYGANGWRLSAWATDANQDGVVDPHDLRDALATAARMLTNTRNQNPKMPEPAVWHLAAYRYYGAESTKYTNDVDSHWARWCAREGRCVTEARLAQND